MGTTVTLNVDPSYVDVVEDYLVSGVQTVTSYTQLESTYLEKLTKESEQLVIASTSMNQQITDNTADVVICNARSTEIDDIIDDVNAL